MCFSTPYHVAPAITLRIGNIRSAPATCFSSAYQAAMYRPCSPEYQRHEGVSVTAVSVLLPAWYRVGTVPSVVLQCCTYPVLYLPSVVPTQCCTSCVPVLYLPSVVPVLYQLCTSVVPVLYQCYTSVVPVLYPSVVPVLYPSVVPVLYVSVVRKCCVQHCGVHQCCTPQCCTTVPGVPSQCFTSYHRRRNHGCSGCSCTHNIQPVGADNVFCTHNIIDQKHPFYHRITEH